MIIALHFRHGAGNARLQADCDAAIMPVKLLPLGVLSPK